MVKDIKEYYATTNPKEIMTPVSSQVKALRCTGVGVGDTATDECISGYVEHALKELLPDDYEKIGEEFYDLIHKG